MFYITYYAKKHEKFITRKGQYDKPDGTKGKSFVSKNGVPCLVYWDLDNGLYDSNEMKKKSSGMDKMVTEK